MSITDKICENITHAMINTKDITIDENGQRDVERRRGQFNRIMKSFDPMKVNDLKVALIDGKYFCFDGQMTMKVLKAKNKNRDLEVPCRIYTGLTLLDISQLFCSQNENKSPIKPGDIIRVQAAYGNETAQGFMRSTEKAGIDLSWNGAKARNAINAISTAYECYKKLNDPELYTTMLKVIKAAWDGLDYALGSQMLKGMTEFFVTYKKNIDADRLARKLTCVRPIDIIRDAQVDRSSGARKYAVIILQIYNKNYREDCKLKNIL